MKRPRKTVWMGRYFLIVVSLLCLGFSIMAWLYHWLVFAFALPCLAAVLVYSILRYLSFHKQVFEAFSVAQMTLVTERQDGALSIPFPAMVVSEGGEVLWHNQAFANSFSKNQALFKSFAHLFETTVDEVLQNPGQIVSEGENRFQTFVIPTQYEQKAEYLVLFVAVTELYNTTKEYHLSRPAVLVLVLDSYEEIVKDAKESEKTYILSEVNRLLEATIATTTGFLVRLSRERYLVVLEQRHFATLVASRFALLSETKNIATTKRIPITLSIGACSYCGTLEENRQGAFLALDMALGRGGDQAAVKTKEGFEFFGGSSIGIESRTKVKTRIVASAMEELISSCDNILIMGHKYPDLDAMGACVGMASACTCLKKEVRIVMEEDKCLAKPLVDYLKQIDKTSLFLSVENAKQWVRRNTLLIICDTHSKLFLESTSIYEACRHIIVIDHHRKTVDYIDDALIFYHEPYASSASELVTELVQYFGGGCKLPPHHAEALLAGVMLDTKNFMMHTGVRTFEAAAYLRRSGADTIQVRKLFASSMDDYKSRSSLVSTAEIYLDCAIASAEHDTDDCRVVAAQAADDLLAIHGVEASFVIFKSQNTMNVSARSLGKINVQIIMEQLGGGGHLTMAAAQLKNTTSEDVKSQLIDLIALYFKNQTN